MATKRVDKGMERRMASKARMDARDPVPPYPGQDDPAQRAMDNANPTKDMTVKGAARKIRNRKRNLDDAIDDAGG